MRLSLAACQPLFEELLLVLQPLSLLTFNLDLLFQHHHLEPESHSAEVPSPPCQDTGFYLSTNRSQSQIRYIESLSDVDFGSPEKSSSLSNPKNGESMELTPPVRPTIGLAETSPQLRWVQEKEIGNLPPPVMEEDSLAQQAGQVLSSTCFSL